MFLSRHFRRLLLKNIHRHDLTDLNLIPPANCILGEWVFPFYRDNNPFHPLTHHFYSFRCWEDSDYGDVTDTYISSLVFEYEDPTCEVDYE